MEKIPDQSSGNTQNIMPYFQMRNSFADNGPHPNQPMSLPSSSFSLESESVTMQTGISQIFSSPFGLITWFFGLKWYVIILIIVFGMFLFFQLEHAIEMQKNGRRPKNDQNNDQPGENKKKEGMQSATVERMKGILRECKTDIPKNNGNATEKETHRPSGIDINKIITQIYNLWIAPWIYIIFRGIGVR